MSFVVGTFLAELKILSSVSQTGLYYLYMRRLIPIWAFALFLAVPLWAQRGGGHGGGFGGGRGASFSGHGGFSGGHFGGFGVHSGSGMSGHFGGMRPGSARGFNGSRTSFSRGPYLHNGFRGRGGFGNRGRFGHRGHFRDRDRFNRFGINNCFGFGCWGGYPWWGYGYYDPSMWDWWNDDYSFDQDYNNNLALANQMKQQSLEQQRMWRQEPQDADQDAYAPYPARPQSAPSAPSNQPAVNDPPATPIIPPTVLVFRDRHQEDIRNYAIVGQTLWSFAPQQTQKIPLAQIDIPATVQANDDRGVTFRIPALTEGQ